MRSGRLLLIDDNRQILESLHILLKDEFRDIDLLPSPARIPEMLWKHAYDVVMLDMNFAAGDTSGNEGIFWLNEIRKRDAQLPVILMTAYGDIDLAVRGIKEGATDFVTKPWDPEKLFIVLHNAFQLRRSAQEVKHLKATQKELVRDMDRQFPMIHGPAGPMPDLLHTLDRVARTDASVLILGENGTGKEVVAREIHKRSDRAGQIFVSVDMGSLSESLFESEMFGHVKGAFTDARDDRAGRFETAHQGTLFLDEIGNIPLSLQAKLLQVLQNREVVRVGGQTPVPVDIRLIAATNQPLAELVQEGKFREDLYYRLNTVSLVVPPLRDRGDDILVLARYYLEAFGRKYLKPGLCLSREAQNGLLAYPWPGNVRELKHSMERAAILADRDELGAPDLRLNQDNLPAGPVSDRLEDVERQAIERVLTKCRGNHSKAAEMLDISRTTLYAKLKKYGL
ncbi:MAG: sigma-54 dependent transcriptional regulator [Bacteroidales bacterium]